MKNSIKRYLVFLLVFSNLAFAKDPKSKKKISKPKINSKKIQVSCGAELPIGLLASTYYLALECNLDFRVIEKISLGTTYRYHMATGTHLGLLGTAYYPMAGSFHVDAAIGFAYAYISPYLGYQLIFPTYQLVMGNRWELESGLVIGLKYNLTDSISTLIYSSQLSLSQFSLADRVWGTIAAITIGPEIGWRF